MAARRMGSNVRWTLLGNVVYAVGQWIQLVIFARLGGAAAVGAYAFTLALTAPVMMLANLQLRMLLASDARGAYAFREYRRLRLATTLAALLAVALIASLTADGRGHWRVLVPVCAMRAAYEMGDVYYGLWQQHQRMRVIGVGLVLNTVSSLAFMALAAALGGGAPGAAAGAALGACASFAFVHHRTAADADLRRSVAAGADHVEWRRIGRLALEGAPLGVIILLGSLQQNIPRYFIQAHSGEAALGLFAAASQLTAAGTTVIGALGGAATPRLARLCAAGQAGAFRALTRKLVAAAALLGLLGVALSALVGREVLVVLFRPEFGAAARVLVILSVGAGLGFVATLLGYALTAARVIAVQPVTLAVALVALVACCSILVPGQGAAGAAWALVAASAVQAICNAAALHRSRIEAGAPNPAVEVA